MEAPLRRANLCAVLLAVVLAMSQIGAIAGGWTTGRPPECGEPGGRAANVWERAKSPELRRYCDLVASAAAKLAGTAAMAAQALSAAQQADRVLPGHAAPWVLEGRALVALGRLDEAAEALAEGKARDPRALEDPLALLAWARVLARTGHAAEAADAYRALLPRATSLSAAERSAAEVEAGLVAMQRGPAGLDEAVAALREAAREAQDETAAVATLALAVALDRRGDTDECRALLADRAHGIGLRQAGDPRTPLASPPARELLAVAPVERDALVAMGLEASDAAGARDAWQSFLAAAPTGPWSEWARAHVSGARVSGKGKTR
jgi:tetratricopeptide (TPR) repeat protein